MTANVMTIFVLCGALLTSACAHGQTADASCNLEPPDLPKLLQAIHPRIEKGYGEQEIATVQRLWESTPLKSTGVKTFPITYRGQSATLRVELKKDDLDEIEIWFITTPELAKEIQVRMRQLAHQGR
jgi:hypothetical protein